MSRTRAARSTLRRAVRRPRTRVAGPALRIRPESTDTSFASSRRVSPELCFVASPSIERGRREDRVPAGTRGPLCEIVRNKIAQRHTGEARTSRPSLRSGFTAYVVLSPGSDALLPPSPCGWLMRAPGRATPHHRKTWRTDPGRQDHTILPYADHTGRVRDAFAHGCPPCETFAPMLSASTAVRPAFVTIAIRPSSLGRSEKFLTKIRILIKRNILPPFR